MITKIIDFDILKDKCDTPAMFFAKEKVDEYKRQGLKVIAKLRQTSKCSAIHIAVYNKELNRYIVQDIINI